jgi:hypothetical protein
MRAEMIPFAIPDADIFVFMVLVMGMRRKENFPCTLSSSSTESFNKNVFSSSLKESMKNVTSKVKGLLDFLLSLNGAGLDPVAI